MDKPRSTMAREIAEAASAFEQRADGSRARIGDVVMGEGTLVITLHEALSPAEKALSQDPAGAAQVQDFHRQSVQPLVRDAYGRRSAGSSGWRSAERPPKSSRRPARRCKSSRSPVAWERRHRSEIS